MLCYEPGFQLFFSLICWLCFFFFFFLFLCRRQSFIAMRKRFLFIRVTLTNALATLFILCSQRNLHFIFNISQQSTNRYMCMLNMMAFAFFTVILHGIPMFIWLDRRTHSFLFFMHLWNVPVCISTAQILVSFCVVLSLFCRLSAGLTIFVLCSCSTFLCTLNR